MIGAVFFLLRNRIGTKKISWVPMFLESELHLAGGCEIRYLEKKCPGGERPFRNPAHASEASV